MPEKQYDNENRLALWAPKDDRRSGYYQGYGEIGGSRVYDAVMIVSERDKGPFANLWWRTEKCQEGDALCTPIWNNDGKLGGKIDGWWVNVWKNETGPALSVTFKRMEEQGQQAPAKQDPPGVTVPDDDDIPF
jgi:hypothetical protein